MDAMAENARPAQGVHFHFFPKDPSGDAEVVRAIRAFHGVPEFPRPAGLEELVDYYAGKEQSPEAYNPDVWVEALDGVLPKSFVRAALERRDVTTRLLDPDRVAVDRAGLVAAVTGADFDDDESVLAAWLLIQAWGNGTRSRWGRQNTARAAAHRDQLLTNLRATAMILRQAHDVAATEDAYRAWVGRIGMNESFVTKWFAFAGIKPGRAWQPLILDRSVWRTLNNTLGLTLHAIAGTTSQWAVYRTYVEMLHEWGGSVEGAQRLEWVLFTHHGLPLPSLYMPNDEASGVVPVNDDFLPTPWAGWEVTEDAFDQSRDPNVRDDYAESHQAEHGRCLVELDAVRDADGSIGGLLQFVHADFGTTADDPKLGELFADVAETVSEHEHEPAYIEVEYYADGTIVFGKIFDAEQMARMDRLTAGDSADPRDRGVPPNELLRWAEMFDDEDEE